MSAHPIPRLKITGRIKNTTDLMIGSGQEDIISREGIDTPYTTLCLAEGNKPYIPASSLRGLLLSLCNRSYGKHSELSNILFGSAKTNDNASTGQMGAVRIYDAISKTAIATQIRTRNAINPITATAKDNFLYSHAYVPADTEFHCELEADHLSVTHAAQLLGLLALLDGKPHSQLGKGQSRQQGLISWQWQSTEAVSTAQLLNWLLDSKPDTPLPYCPHALNQQLPPALSALQSFKLIFSPQSPILINDPSRVSKEEGKPKLEFYRNPKGQLQIPASSLKGVLRSQCRKILLTIFINQAGLPPTADHTHAIRLTDELLGELFGNSQQQSKLWLSDATAENTEAHLQTFNAVDRFTGGVADGALYTANAATATTIHCELYCTQPLADWQQGLLVLLLRDAMEGDLTVGWGKAKGFGVMILTEMRWDGHSINSWTELSNDAEKLVAMQANVDKLLTHLIQKQGEEQS